MMPIFEENWSVAERNFRASHLVDLDVTISGVSVNPGASVEVMGIESIQMFNMVSEIQVNYR